jgi:hypothetical protein
VAGELGLGGDLTGSSGSAGSGAWPMGTATYSFSSGIAARRKVLEAGGGGRWLRLLVLWQLLGKEEGRQLVRWRSLEGIRSRRGVTGLPHARYRVVLTGGTGLDGAYVSVGFEGEQVGPGSWCGVGRGVGGGV